ncbi:hypothetical protein [Streptomyces cavernae]|uniref:hypothetical protein n=1 Tax=Streptomyces cavernae TaxID=2259034 RepID=UPI0030B8446F
MRATAPEAVAVAFGVLGGAEGVEGAAADAVAFGTLEDAVGRGFGAVVFGFGVAVLEGLAEALGVFDAVGARSPSSEPFQR